MPLLVGVVFFLRQPTLSCALQAKQSAHIKSLKKEIAINPSPINIGEHMNTIKLIPPSSALSERPQRWPLRTAFTPLLAFCLCLLAGGASASLAQTTGSATLRGI